MRKRLVVIVLLLFASLPLAFATELYLRSAFAITYDTNVFSNPLPGNSNAAYMRRTGVGYYLDADMFFTDKSKVGLSLSFLYSNPVKIDPIINGDKEELDESYAWVFSEDPDIYFALGPMFRAKLGDISLGIALRVEVGSNNMFEDSINVGLQVEPYIMIPLGTGRWQFSAGLLYDAHFYDFLLNDSSRYYRSGYFLLTLGGYIGLAYRWSS